MATLTVEMDRLLKRVAAGEQDARNDLINMAHKRLSALAAKLLDSFGGEPRIGMQTTEVVNEAVLRLTAAIDEVQPQSVRQFMGLAREHMRRVLLDRVRKIDGRGEEKHPIFIPIDGLKDTPTGKAPPGNTALIRALDFLEAIGKLPEIPRDVVTQKLTGLTHREIGELMQLSESDVIKHWETARLTLARHLSSWNPSADSRERL